MPTHRLWAVAMAALMMASCSRGYNPATAEQIVTTLVAADLLECDERRDPFPEVISCVDPDGQVTIALTDDSAEMAQQLDAEGPFLVGGTWIILSYDGDQARVVSFRETLGGGEVFVRDDDGTMQPVS